MSLTQKDSGRCIWWKTSVITIARSEPAVVEEWHRKHPVQSLALRSGLKKPPAALQRLAQTHAESSRFLQGSQWRLEELEQAWLKKRLMYQQQLEREGEEIRKAIGEIEGNLEHFREKREEQTFQNREQAQRRGRGEPNRGWSR